MNVTDSGESYWATDDIETVVHCPVCGSMDFVHAYSHLVDTEEGVPGLWSMKSCRQCSSLILDPRPVPHALHKAYRTYYTHRAPEGENAVLSGGGFVGATLRTYLRQRFGWNGSPGIGLTRAVIGCIPPVRHQLAYFMRHLPDTPGRLLDVGCGNGAFMLRAKQAGWHVEGVEPDRVAAAVARESTGAPVYDSFSDLPSRSFDQVTLSHVIEHLHEPTQVLERCSQVLKPGGRIWLATPNINGKGHRYFRCAWQPLETPRHLSMPSATGLQMMLNQAGFSNIRFRPRGRGSRKRIEASSLRISSDPPSGAARLLLSQWIDFVGSFSSMGAEELVLTAEVSAR